MTCDDDDALFKYRSKFQKYCFSEEVAVKQVAQGNNFKKEEKFACFFLLLPAIS